MIRNFIVLLFFFQIAFMSVIAGAQNPFQPDKESPSVQSEPPAGGTLLIKLALYQQKLKQKMTGLIREVKTEKTIKPLLWVLLIAFAYGFIHAAGPGHGKAVAMSFILSANPSLITGLLFGVMIALVHGSSGAICVMALHFVLKNSVSGGLAEVSQITQIVSFSLILLLGIGILVKNSRALLIKSELNDKAQDGKTISATGLIPWALSVGLVPCPGVVMVMLFCLSMNVIALGLALAVCITLGMATTITIVVTTVVIGKARLTNAFSEKQAQKIEGLVGILSGTAIVVLGSLFLLATIR